MATLLLENFDDEILDDVKILAKSKGMSFDDFIKFTMKNLVRKSPITITNADDISVHERIMQWRQENSEILLSNDEVNRYFYQQKEISKPPFWINWTPEDWGDE